jgi:hypothetical protein
MQMYDPNTHETTPRLCIPLGTTFESLHLLFRWHLSSAFPQEHLLSFFTFYFGGILALHSLRNDFWASELTLRSLRNDFCSFVTFGVALQLCIPLGTTFELFTVLFALDGADSDITCYIFGGIWPLYCIGLNKKKWKLQTMAPLKTFLPSWKEKGAIGKK